jgi:hypothetical protein
VGTGRLASVTGSVYSSEHMFAFSTKRPPLSDDIRAALRPVTLAKSKLIPVSEPWRTLLVDGGLRRGSTIAVQAPSGWGGLSLGLSLVSEASTHGHWAGVVGVDDPGVVAIADLGLDLRRVLFVPRPRGAWAESAADLLDGVDLLVVRPPSRAAHGAARKLMDRVRERGTVLIALTEPSAPWPLPAELTLTVAASRWVASSRLESRALTVRVSGRGRAGREGEHTILLPDPRGRAVAS